MGIRIIKLPDVGEGVAEAELVEWHVKVGQSVLEDQLLAAVMTDKATVEIPSPVAGTVVALGAEVGGVLAVGAELIRLEVAGEGNEEVVAEPREAATAPRRKAGCSCTSAGTSIRRRTVCASGVGHARAARTAATARRETDRLACGAAARTRGRRRSAPGARHRAGGPDQPGRPRCLPARWTEDREIHRPGGQYRGRDRQDHRPAPAHRPEDGRVETPGRSFLLCRGGRRHRARGAARDPECRDTARIDRG